MKDTLSYNDIKSFTLGFLPYFIAVVVADVYKGSGVINIYYVLILIWCITSLPRMLKTHIAPIELLCYFSIIITVEYLNKQHSKYYYEGLLQIISLIVLSNYLISYRKINYFTIGMACSIVIGCIYFCLFASNSSLNIGDSELRHSLPFFYISNVGLMTSLGYFLALTKMKGKYKFNWAILAAVCLLTCLYSLSKNAIVAMIVITIIYLKIIRAIRFNWKTITVLLLICFSLMLIGNTLDPIIAIFTQSIDFNSSDEIINVSGRSGIWLFAVENIKNNPWFGHGYYTASELLMILNDNISQAHNGILHALLATGRIGLILLTIYIIRCFSFIRKNLTIVLNNSSLRWIFCILMYFMIRSLTEASFAQCGSMDVFWFFLLTFILRNVVTKNV